MRIGESFCPGILHAVPAKDGLLTRIRVPGGFMLASQLSAVARLSAAFANGQVEITSRANLQLRAIKGKDLEPLTEGLISAGFLPSPAHDRVRNIVTSPFAGLTKEITDTGQLVRELDRRLIESLDLVRLPAKFNFALDGGGVWFSRDSDDLSLRAVSLGQMVYFHLVIGGAFSGFGVTADRAVECLLEAARGCLRVADKYNLPARGRRISAHSLALSDLLDGLSHVLVSCPMPNDLTPAADMPVGICATGSADCVNLVPSVPLGRLTAEQAQSLSMIAEEWRGDLRLAPWRGVVLGAIPDKSLAEISSNFQAVGLSCDGKDGYRGMAACAGNGGCDASLADVRRDATLLAARLAGSDAKSGWSINISGCDKQCAMRSGAMVELVANHSGYSLAIDGDSIASSCSLEFAMEAVVAQQRKDFEVFCGNRL